jgi:hypothetical protein
VVPIVYSNELAWGIYPNPSDGMFRLKYQVEPGKTAAVDIFNAAGAIVKKYTIAGNGFIQNFDIDLKNGVFAKGLYMIRITAGNKQYHFKVTKL